LKTLWPFLKPYKKSLVLLLFFAIAVGLLETATIAVLYPLLTLSLDLSAGQAGNPFLALVGSLAKIIPVNDPVIAYCILFIILVILSLLFNWLLVYFSAKTASAIVANNQQKVFDKYVNSAYQYFVDNKQGELIYNCQVAPSPLGSVVNILMRYAAEVILSISVFVLLFSISWKSSLLVIGAAVAYFFFARFIGSKVAYIAGTAQYQASQRRAVTLNEFLTGVKQIKVFQTFAYWREQFFEAVSIFWTYWRQYTVWTQTPTVLLSPVVYLLIVIVVIVIRIQEPTGFTSIVPLFGTFGFAVLRLAPKISAFGYYHMQIMNQLPNLELVSRVLAEEGYRQIQDGKIDLTTVTSNIELKDVEFAYKGRTPVLKDVSLKIEKNRMTAIVGMSGSGKSTIANLLLRLYPVDKGDIYLDDVNIKEFNIFSFLEKTGYVDQETFIYNASVKDNIAFGREYPMSEIIEAAKLANADDFIQQLPQGYDTLVGDRGIKLSGGEKQRLAVARAMVRKPEILILDEATSSLDNVSEKIVQEAIDRVARNTTTLVIAHRLSTIRNADKIYVLDKGKVIESGTHQELMDQKGKYWELYNTQER